MCHKYAVTGRQLKRRKDTSSGPGVSPVTLRSQPPYKRRFSASKQLFTNGMYNLTCKDNHYIYNTLRPPTYSSPNTGTK